MKYLFFDLSKMFETMNIHFDIVLASSYLKLYFACIL